MTIHKHSWKFQFVWIFRVIYRNELFPNGFNFLFLTDEQLMEFISNSVSTDYKFFHVFLFQWKHIWIKPPLFWCLQATFYIYIFHLLSNRLFMLYFGFFSWRDRIFILFLLMTWPEYVFLKNIADPSQKQMVTPIRDTETDPEVVGPPF
jgi:hypothetical protein